MLIFSKFDVFCYIFYCCIGLDGYEFDAILLILLLLFPACCSSTKGVAIIFNHTRSKGSLGFLGFVGFSLKLNKGGFLDQGPHRICVFWVGLGKVRVSSSVFLGQPTRCSTLHKHV
ncbi:hypothetical protein HanRHA438_Chr16g0759121 [Helianthus annuus]|nr:hypothetical protein HanRHA438_Chr16g0759121 [Helianthus annuus]